MKRFVIFVFLTVFFVACQQTTEKKELTSLADYNSKDIKIGILSGTTFGDNATESFPKAKQLVLSSTPDIIEALHSGLINGFLYDQPNLNYMAQTMPQLTYVPEYLTREDYVYYLRKDSRGKKLTEQLNSFITSIKESGELAQINKYWFTNLSQQRGIDVSDLTGPNGTIRLATSLTSPPMTFLLNNRPAGYEIDIIYRFAKKFGYKLEIIDSNVDAIIPNVSTRADIAACVFAYTDERAKILNYTIPHYKGGVVLAILKSKIPSITTLKELSGKRIAVRNYKNLVEYFKITKILDLSNLKPYDSIQEELQALREDRVKAVIMDRLIATMISHRSVDLMLAPEFLDNYSLFFALKKDSAFIEAFNNALEELIKTSTIDKIGKKWLNSPYQLSLPVQDWDAPNGELKYLYDNSLEPISFTNIDNEPAGIELEIALEIARKLGYKLKFYGVDYSVTDLSSTIKNINADIASYDPDVDLDKRSLMSLSNPYYESELVFIVKAKSVDSSDSNLIDDIKKSFYNNFIREDRWKLVVRGLATTIMITLCAAFLGTIFGGLICFIRLRKNRFCRLFARNYVLIFRNTPILVILMILFYLVFAKTGLPGEMVAIIAFSLDFTAYSSEIFRTGIASIDKGQYEAAYGLGFNRIQTFMKIILPQALKNFIPVYTNEFISLLKGTSIVGYIAIQDLTKVTDIIRSRTFEAFFPLICAAVIYFSVAIIITHLLHKLQKWLCLRKARNA